MRVLSLGAGVQSSTLLLMAYRGELEIERAIFADTGWEPKAVYTYLEYLRSLPGMVPITTVSNGHIREQDAPSHRAFATMPLYVEADGKARMLRRQCTKEYKITPIRRELRTIGATATHPVDLLMGISLDEVGRMRDSNVKYIRNEYPLVDLRLTRTDCLHWMERAGFPEPPRSACIGCPFRRDKEWRSLTPDEMDEAIAFDHKIRQIPRIHGQTFLHRSLIPLDQVDFRDEHDRGQLDLFGDECEGMCGV